EAATGVGADQHSIIVAGGTDDTVDIAGGTTDVITAGWLVGEPITTQIHGRDMETLRREGSDDILVVEPPAERPVEEQNQGIGGGTSDGDMQAHATDIDMIVAVGPLHGHHGG